MSKIYEIQFPNFSDLQKKIDIEEDENIKIPTGREFFVEAMERGAVAEDLSEYRKIDKLISSIEDAERESVKFSAEDFQRVKAFFEAFVPTRSLNKYSRPMVLRLADAIESAVESDLNLTRTDGSNVEEPAAVDG